MDAESGQSRLILISLDGMDASQLRVLSEFVPELAKLIASSNLTPFDTRPFTSPQPIWAEILSGKPWWENGCVSYARPVNSLNNLEIVTEDLFPEVSQLLGNEPRQDVLLVNMPILKPKPGRYWLSDGSLPTQITVSPIELSQRAPFSEYKARPFASSSAALGDQKENITKCLSLEKQRLSCALELIDKRNWQICLLRLTVFDLLAHLIGSDVLYSSGLTVKKQLEDFYFFLNECLAKIRKLHPSATICLISTLSHTRCLARLNLNELLAAGGFCQLAETPERNQLYYEKRRAEASRAVVATFDDVTATALPMVAKTNSFSLAKTVAGSPVQGAIYLNRKSRFDSGIVEESEVKPILQQVERYLNDVLVKEFGSTRYLWGQDIRSNISSDLLVYVDGVEIHNSAGPPAIDKENRPRSAHKASGFVSFPKEFTRLTGQFTSLDIHRVLKEILA